MTYNGVSTKHILPGSTNHRTHLSFLVVLSSPHERDWLVGRKCREFFIMMLKLRGMKSSQNWGGGGMTCLNSPHVHSLS